MARPEHNLRTRRLGLSCNLEPYGQLPETFQRRAGAAAFLIRDKSRSHKSVLDPAQKQFVRHSRSPKLWVT